MKKITIFLVLATLCLFTTLQSQGQITVTGQVRSQSTGQPLAGATVSISGTTLSITTAENGTFTIRQVPPQGTLQISYTGYLTAIRPFSAVKNTLDITLEDKDNALEEVKINAGYYSVKDKERTGTIVKIDAKTIANQPVSNPLAALQGRVAGLIITQRNGLPGSDFNVQLRGRSSIQSGTSPLYLIDGIPFPSETLAQNSAIFANSPLNTINPADIESIEILKDADATAIYGSRGANGVILITTKKGKEGGIAADFRLSGGIGSVTKTLELMNTQEYLQMRREAFVNDKVSPTNANAPDLLLWDNNRYQNFPELLTGGTSKTQNAQLRLSGGNNSTTYAFSTNYYRETTVFPGDNGLARKDASINLNHRSPNKKFNFNLSGSYGTSQNNLYATDLTGSITTVPNAPIVYDGNGKLVWVDQGVSFVNPFAGLLRTNSFKGSRFNGNFVMGYQFIKGLEFKISTGINTNNINQTSLTPIAAQNPASSPTGFASFADNLVENFSVEPQVNYTLKTKSSGEISFLVGSTFQGTSSRGTFTSASGYTNDLLIGSIAGALTKDPTNTVSEYRYQAFFGRVNYNLHSKYLINLTGRRDGSSRFGPGRQFANFGAIGVAWVFSQEDFIKEKLGFLSFGKIRGSYGITGNDQISNYQYLDSYLPTTAYGGQSGLFSTRLFNENYGWENNIKLEANLELGFINDRLRMNVGWFRNISDNQLVSYSLPGQTGFSSVLQNLDAKIENQGFEFEVNTVNFRTNQFNWSTSANVTIARNKLLAFPGLAASSYATTYFIGLPLNTVQGYQYTGISPQTGAYQFQDSNGDGLITIADYQKLGTSDPSFYGGISNTFQYKGLSLDVFFQFCKQKGTDPVYGSAALVGSRVNVPKVLIDRWTPENPDAQYQAYSQASSGPINTSRLLIRTSSASFVDASFIRLKNLAISYSLPYQLISKIKIKSAKIFLQGQNLWTISPYKITDPESQSITALPPLRMGTIGIQLML